MTTGTLDCAEVDGFHYMCNAVVEAEEEVLEDSEILDVLCLV